MRILVTGGAGFIGSSLVDRWVTDGHQVAILDNLSTGRRDYVNPRATFLELDIVDAPAVDRAIGEFRPEVVSHHAAQMDVRRSVLDPAFDARTNVLGSIALLEACARHGVRKVIYASTGGAIYGEGRSLPAAEDHPIHPESPYGASKYAVELYLKIWQQLHGLDFTVLRYPNVFGPRQNPHGEAGVNAIFIGLMLAGQRPRIFGHGDAVRDYLFVDDVVAANVLALGSAGGEVMNLGTGVPTSVTDIVRELNGVLGTNLEPIQEPDRPGEIQRIYLDAARANRLLGWTPTVTFREGLRRTVDWARARGAQISA